MMEKIRQLFSRKPALSLEEEARLRELEQHLDEIEAEMDKEQRRRYLRDRERNWKREHDVSY